MCEVMVNKADDNPKVLFTPYSWVPGCLPYYNAALPTHFVVLALPFSAKMNVVGAGNPYAKFYEQYPHQAKILIIYDAIDDVPANEIMTPASSAAIAPQMEQINKTFLGVFSWLVQPSAHQIKKIRETIDKWHYSVKYEALPEPGKATQFENQVTVLK